MSKGVGIRGGAGYPPPDMGPGGGWACAGVPTGHGIQRDMVGKWAVLILLVSFAVVMCQL